MIILNLGKILEKNGIFFEIIGETQKDSLVLDKEFNIKLNDLSNLEKILTLCTFSLDTISRLCFNSSSTYTFKKPNLCPFSIGAGTGVVSGESNRLPEMIKKFDGTFCEPIWIWKRLDSNRISKTRCSKTCYIRIK